MMKNGYQICEYSDSLKSNLELLLIKKS